MPASRLDGPDDPTSDALMRLRREVRLLKLYSLGLTAAVGLLLAGGAGFADRRQKFDEIDVERLNVVEKDGRLRMVFSNGERCPDAVVDGKVLKGRSQGATPGIIFYNDGGECGGLVFHGGSKGGRAAAGMSMTFDQLRQDQTIGLQYDEEGGARSAALRVWDLSDIPYSELAERFPAAFRDEDSSERAEARRKLAEVAPAALRVVVGKDRERAAVVRLADAKGRTRIKIAVDADGSPRMEFLDERGEVTYRVPPH